ncbi:hypothetical protein BDR06DRAFT_971024 [Suillus hirtellus]|nr:hypothetical protein BDR06DRAFT_971024 [Suillus hirtellus]
MEPPSSPSSTITAPPNYHDVAQRLGRLIVEAMTSSSALLHYDNASQSMVEWCWPADSEGKKIPPSNFKKYRNEYEFSGGKVAYVEAAVYPWWNNTTKQTHWTARYNIKHHLVKIDIYFNLVSSVAFRYPRRDDKNPPIPPIRLEWTFREETQLLDRLAFGVIRVRYNQKADKIQQRDYLQNFEFFKAVVPDYERISSIESKRKAKVVSLQSLLHVKWKPNGWNSLHHPPLHGAFSNSSFRHKPWEYPATKQKLAPWIFSKIRLSRQGLDYRCSGQAILIYIHHRNVRHEKLQGKGHPDWHLQFSTIPFLRTKNLQNLGDKQGVFQTSESRLIDSWVIAGVEESALHQVNADDIQVAVPEKLAVYTCSQGIGRQTKHNDFEYTGYRQPDRQIHFLMAESWTEIAISGIQSPLQIVYLEHLKNHNWTNIVPVHPMMSACPVTSYLFDNTIARINVFQLSNTLGIGLLDAYIGLIANHKLQTEVRVLSVLLKDQVYPADLWEIIGECTIEAQQEAILRQHQNNCTGEFVGRRHVVTEHLLMLERKKQSQMEVSLYTQAIEHLQQQRLRMRDISFSSSMTSTCAAPFACPTATRDKCEAWLKKPYIHPLPFVQPLVTEKYPFLDRSTLTSPGSTTHKDTLASCVGPSLPLLSAWVTLDVQETFYDAFHVEQAYQAGLTLLFLFANGHHAYPSQCNIGLELLVLQAKMRCAKAEVDLYAMVIENACEHDFPVSTSTLSSLSGFIPLPRPDELYYYSDDHDTEFDDFDDPESD